MLCLHREQGYALMCVGFPLTDMVLETVPEDEVYDLQFGSVFASQVGWYRCQWYHTV